MGKDIIKECNGESCSWCMNRKNCNYRRKQMELTREAIKSILHLTAAYCHGNVTCDYYAQDKDEYYKINGGEIQCKG